MRVDFRDPFGSLCFGDSVGDFQCIFGFAASKCNSLRIFW